MKVTGSSADIIFSGNLSSHFVLGTTSAIADFNGDNNLDIAFAAMGAPGADLCDPINCPGKIHIYHGSGSRDFDTQEDITLTAPGSNWLGENMMKTGDINGDGFDDLLTDESYNRVANVYLFYGGTNMRLEYDTKFIGESTSDMLTREASDIGDINKDGLDDFCVGASRNSTLASKQGRVYCFFASKDLYGEFNIESRADIIFNGENENDNFGRYLKLKDLNNDGILDLLVGAYQLTGIANGYINIYLGNGSSFSETADIKIQSTDIGETEKRFGNSLNVGDIDNNGWMNIFVTSARGGNGTGETGRVHIFEVTHGNPQITSELTGDLNDTQTTITGTATDPDFTIAGVQWSLTNDPAGEWFDCTAVDGEFDSHNEEFSCDVEGLSGGEQTVYFRSYDENDLYMPVGLYEVNEVEVVLSETGGNVISNWYLVVCILFSLVLLSKINKKKSDNYKHT